jgi:ketosteroid isomerase-like protein
MNEDQEAVWRAMNRIYELFLLGDSTAVDALMHPDVTIWDSEEPAMATGLVELQAVRTRRPVDPGAPKVIAIEASDPVIDVRGDIALVRHLLTVQFSPDDVPDQHVRNTSVWRRVDGQWLAVHNHEDVLR